MKKKRFVLFLLLLPLLLAGFLFLRNADSLRFRRITASFFTHSLENDALSLHFTLARPENYGISLQDAVLPPYSKESQKQAALATRSYLKRLSGLTPARLSEEERYTYDLLSSYLRTQEAGLSFPYYEEPLSPSSGMQTELPLLLAEYTFRSKEDVDTYLSLLESVAPYLEGLADYEAEKAQAGLFMTADDASRVIAQCDAILNADSLSDGSHFLQKTFRSRLEQLSKKGLLTDAEMQLCLAENDRLLSTVVAPAYQKLGDALTLLSDAGQYSGGLCAMPDGRAYYAWLVQRTTGASLDVDGIYLLLQKTFQKNFLSLKEDAVRYQTLTGNAPDPAFLAARFPLSDPSAILTDLQKRMQEDFPPLSALSPEPVSCTVKDVDTALEAYTSPAFFLSPPLDDLTHNTICINRTSTADGLSLYTTLAHEGYPGHLYQTVYSSLYTSVQKKQPVRELLFYGGYVEGWAYYTEHLSYDYAADLLTGADSFSAAALLCRLSATQRDLQINLFSILDIALHYYGATRAEILRSLTSFGLPEESAAHVYDYLRTSPAVYLKYYVGYLEMTALRERARAQWGDGFSNLRFHQFVLEAGPSDFSNLTRRLRSTASDK